MSPNDPQNNPGNPASLPAMPAIPQQAPVAASSQQHATQTVNGDVAVRAAAQAKQLISQYGGDPYRLSESLNQLKAAYLADQFHITPNQAEN
jgi:hypothetical protein